jgi:hypothetical protein
MNGSNKTYNAEKREALYVTSFPHQRYRRPALAARALRLLNIKTKLLSGWETVSRYRPISTMVKASAYLPPPLNWLTKDIAYETGLLAAVRSMKLYLCINLNVVGGPCPEARSPRGPPNNRHPRLHNPRRPHNTPLRPTNSQKLHTKSPHICKQSHNGDN